MSTPVEPTPTSVITAIVPLADSSAPAPAAAAPAAAPLAGGVFPRIDDDMPEDDEEDEDYFDEEEEDEWDADKELSRAMEEVDDQDWGDLHGDFTRRYNRMRQHVVATHAALPTSANSSAGPSATRPAAGPSGAVLPAANRPKALPKTALTSSSDPSKAAQHTNKVSDQLATFGHKFNDRITLAPLYSTNATTSRKGGSEKVLIKDKSDRATNEQVLDPRTRLILFKMLGRGLLERIDGCVSTGKEANVYHAVSPKVEAVEASEGVAAVAAADARHIALKIYKTSILIFKDRDRYVTGEFRFKSGYARSNPRKMVRLWAEKEMRNLRRMRTAGLRVPEPIEVRENVLVMEFMGNNEEDGWQASPRLKDAALPADQHRPLYLEILLILRVIFNRCKLVHADFSEYNILYHLGHLVVIDVSQSVEQDHPAAFDFLRQDIKNADDFFRRLGVDTLGLTRTFNFVTGRSWVEGRQETDEDVLAEAERLVREVEEAEDDVEEEEETDHSALPGAKKANKPKVAKPSESDEAVFAQAYIPRALDQVYDPERDVAKVLRGEGDGLIYADITGVAKIRLDEQGNPEGEEDEEEEEGSEDGSDGDSGEEEEGEEGARRPRGKKHEDRDEKKARRNAVKEENRAKRAVKMKKADKAKKVKKTSGKK